MINDMPSFAYNPRYYGGTEYIAKRVVETILPDLPKFKEYDCILLPGYNPDEVMLSNKKKIIWFHNLLNQYDARTVSNLSREGFFDTVKFIITVSEYHKRSIIEDLNIPEDKVFVIYNSIDPVSYDLNKFNNINKVKIIHASGHERGMDWLLNSLQYIDQDFELSIYNGFNPDTMELPPLINFKDDPRVIFYGQTPKKTVLKAFSESHIHAYPATFLETFCLAQAESLSAGCVSVYNPVGALEEISSGFGFKSGIKRSDPFEDSKIFAKDLDKAITYVKSNTLNIEDQSDFINSKFSWSNAKARWQELHNLI
jgi:glycosyltransferase involved in cell wall biosynthesis